MTIIASDERDAQPSAKKSDTQQKIENLLLEARPRPRSDRWEDRFLAVWPNLAGELGWDPERARKRLNQHEARAKRREKRPVKNEPVCASYAEVEAVLAAMDEEAYPQFDLRTRFAGEVASFDQWLMKDNPKVRQLRKKRNAILRARLLQLNYRSQNFGGDPSRSEFAALLSEKIGSTSEDAARRRLKVLHDLEQASGPWQRVFKQG